MDGPTYEDLMRELERRIPVDAKPKRKGWRRILSLPRTITGKLLPVLLALVVVASAGLAYFAWSYVGPPTSATTKAYPIQTTILGWAVNTTTGYNGTFTVSAHNPSAVNTSGVFLVVTGTCTPDPGSGNMSVVVGELNATGNFTGTKLDLCSGGQYFSSSREVPTDHAAEWHFFQYVAAGYGTATITVRPAAPA